MEKRKLLVQIFGSKCFVAILCLFICCHHNVNAQDIDLTSLDNKEISILSAKDSIYLNVMSSIFEQMKPRYKLYKTENTYNLLKLDTATGAIWQVQYGMNKSAERMVVEIDSSSLLYSFEYVVPGRFELYETNNMYTFILLDTKKGYTYQVQWNTSRDSRFRIPIY